MVAVTALCGVPAASALPAQFPDLDVYPEVDPATYQVLGARPSTSGWAFSTPSGLHCQNSLIAELGVSCSASRPAMSDGIDSASVSLTRPGMLTRTDTAGTDGVESFPLLPTGSKLAAGNGVECAVISDDALACLARRPDSWPPDTPDPPDRHYGEHGFVVAPGHSWAF
ncbi:hypothetical protein ACAG25_16045 [Mycobacterium sp. pV006]|uniref:hypothetical protein n=1 Tax=Mycobacterium sp. pV006 TaxID=3238983 RepID=UPI00351BAE25